MPGRSNAVYANLARTIDHLLSVFPDNPVSVDVRLVVEHPGGANAEVTMERVNEYPDGVVAFFRIGPEVHHQPVHYPRV